MYNYTPQATHHATFDFDPTMSVVWANSLFDTVLGVFLSFSFLLSSARLQVVRIFNFHIFAYFSPKFVKIKPKIGNFKLKC